ncbi:hypothetical protein BGW38_000627 [Lunasporangiospora selenospora]|uniref:Transmembrane protein n=1 Tax=Lunasporangiospora selenospora TaxID=979761 RepID=A0A9P6FUU1_9FUNG|nr:hypothetical protein BGW38_000627 [Lunasporangiospora selenospora]
MRVISTVIGVLPLIVGVLSQDSEPWKTPTGGMGYMSDRYRLVIHGGSARTFPGNEDVVVRRNGYFQLDLSSNWTTDDPPWTVLHGSDEKSLSGIGLATLPSGETLVLATDIPNKDGPLRLVTISRGGGAWIDRQNVPSKLEYNNQKNSELSAPIFVSPKGEIFFPAFGVMMPSIDSSTPVNIMNNERYELAGCSGWSNSLNTIIATGVNGASMLIIKRLIKSPDAPGLGWQEMDIGGETPGEMFYMCMAKARKLTLLSIDGAPRIAPACAATKRAFVAWGDKFVAEYIPPPPPPPPIAPPPPRTSSPSSPSSTTVSTSPSLTSSPDPSKGDEGGKSKTTTLDGNQSEMKTIAIAGGVGGGAILISFIALILCVRHGNKKKKKSADQKDLPKEPAQDTCPKHSRRGSWSSDGEEVLKTRRSEYRSTTRPREKEYRSMTRPREKEYRSMAHPREEEYVDDFRNKESSSFLDEGSERDLVQAWHRQRQDSFSDTELRSSRQKGFSQRSEFSDSRARPRERDTVQALHRQRQDSLSDTELRSSRQKGFSRRSEYSDSRARPRERDEQVSTVGKYRTLANRRDPEDDDWDQPRQSPTRNETTIKKQRGSSRARPERQHSGFLNRQSPLEPEPSPTTQRSRYQNIESPQPRDPHFSNSRQIGLQFGYIQPNDPQFISDTSSSQYINSHFDEALLPPESQFDHISNHDSQYMPILQRRGPQDDVPLYFNPNFDTPQPGNPQIGGSQRATIFSHRNPSTSRGPKSSQWPLHRNASNAVPRGNAYP